MKKLFALALCAALLLAASSALAADINFVTAGTASTFYPISVTIVDLWNQNIEGMNAVATPSGGGVDNLNQALDGEAQIGIANANLVYQSQQGLASFEGYPNENIRIFAGLLFVSPSLATDALALVLIAAEIAFDRAVLRKTKPLAAA